ncbi:MAG: hypothetical protein ABI412_07220 [Sphingomicrobium sp.]
MKKLILLGAVAMLAACNTKEAPPANNAVVADDMNVAADANAVVATAGPVMTLLGSSWEFTREGKPIQESIDSNGNYIAVSGAEHIDHGTYAQVDGKQCFTSAMTKEGQICWTAPAQMEVGGSADITSDKGEKLTVKRVAYVPRKM